MTEYPELVCGFVFEDGTVYYVKRSQCGTRYAAKSRRILDTHWLAVDVSFKQALTATVASLPEGRYRMLK